MKTVCEYYNSKTCSSCSLIDLNYQEQLTLKEDLLKTALKLDRAFPLLPTVSSRLTGFRNKAKIMVTGTLEHPILGLQGEATLDQGREILHCPVHHPKLNELIGELKDYVQLARLSPYQIGERSGELKGFILFISEETQEMYLRVILRSKEALDRVKKHSSHLFAKFPHLMTLSVNIQPVPHALLEGDEEVILTERTYVNHKLGDLHLRVGPQGFVQTNQAIAHRLYATAAEWVRDLHISTFMELYSGQGAFSFFVAPFVKRAVGVEINPSAVSEANRTRLERGLTQLEFICADATTVESELTAHAPDLVLVNPPRKGLGSGVEMLLRHPSAHLLYSSCSYETLGADLEKLSSVYRVKKVQLFDMFPHTRHFETLVLLERI